MSEPATDRIVLEGSYPLHELVPLKSRLQSAIRADAHLDVITENLPDASLSLVQLFFAAQRQAIQKGCSLSIQCAEGSALAATLKQSGFADAAPQAPVIGAGMWSGLAANLRV
jgi:hypothetical protein